MITTVSCQRGSCRTSSRHVERVPTKRGPQDCEILQNRKISRIHNQIVSDFIAFRPRAKKFSTREQQVLWALHNRTAERLFILVAESINESKPGALGCPANLVDKHLNLFATELLARIHGQTAGMVIWGMLHCTLR